MKTLFIISLLSTICSGLTVSGNETVNITGRMGVGNLVCLDNSIAYIYNLTGYSQITSISASGDSKVLFDVPVLKISYQDGLYGAGRVQVLSEKTSEAISSNLATNNFSLLVIS